MSTLYNLDFRNCTFVNPISRVDRAVCYCSNLRALDLSDADFSQITAQNSFLKDLFKLEDFSGVNVTCNLNLSTMRSLTHQSAVNVINALETVESTRTLTLFSAVKNLLTAEEIAVATAKGWTVA